MAQFLKMKEFKLNILMGWLLVTVLPNNTTYFLVVTIRKSWKAWNQLYKISFETYLTEGSPKKPRLQRWLTFWIKSLHASSGSERCQMQLAGKRSCFKKRVNATNIVLPAPRLTLNSALSGTVFDFWPLLRLLSSDSLSLTDCESTRTRKQQIQKFAPHWRAPHKGSFEIAL